MENYSYTTAAKLSTADMPTLADMKRIMDEHRRKFPPSKMAVCLSGDRQTIDRLIDGVQKHRPDLVRQAVFSPLGSLFGPFDGIAVVCNPKVPHGYYRIRFADGKSKQYSIYGGEPVDVEDDHN